MFPLSFLKGILSAADIGKPKGPGLGRASALSMRQGGVRTIFSNLIRHLDSTLKCAIRIP